MIAHTRRGFLARIGAVLAVPSLASAVTVTPRFRVVRSYDIWRDAYHYGLAEHGLSLPAGVETEAHHHSEAWNPPTDGRWAFIWMARAA